MTYWDVDRKLRLKKKNHYLNVFLIFRMEERSAGLSLPYLSSSIGNAELAEVKTGTTPSSSKI